MVMAARRQPCRIFPPRRTGSRSRRGARQALAPLLRPYVQPPAQGGVVFQDLIVGLDSEGHPVPRGVARGAHRGVLRRGHFGPRTVVVVERLPVGVLRGLRPIGDGEQYRGVRAPVLRGAEGAELVEAAYGEIGPAPAGP